MVNKKLHLNYSGISSLCFTNAGEALYMMSSSELQRISLATSKIVYPDGIINIEPLKTEECVENHIADQESIKHEDADADIISTATKRSVTVTSTTTSAKINEDHVSGLTNGVADGNSPNRANETISSSIGDITVDSVRDHLNTTTTTLCSTTTEETVGMFFLSCSFF